MSRDLVALLVTVEVDPEAWEATYRRGPYDANDVVDYVREQLQQSGAVTISRCMSSDVQVRFRRQPTEPMVDRSVKDGATSSRSTWSPGTS